MQRTLETESFKGIKEAYTVLPSVINRILKLKKGQNGTFVRNNRHSSRMNVPKDALHVDGAINKSLARNLPKLQPTSFQQIVKQVGARYPDWTSTRYGGGNAANGKCPTPKEAVAILKAITQARHSVFQWQSSLPREPLVRGLLRSIQTETGCIADDLPSSLVPDVIRCLGTIGRDSYFESEMDTLCSLIPRVEFVSTQQVHSVLRGLCLSRHWTTHLPQLELSVIKLLTDEPQSVSPRSIRYAAHCCQGLVFLGHTPSGLFRLLETMYDDEQLFSWEASISLAWSLAIGGNDSIHRALVGKLLEGILRHAESLPDYINSRLSMLGQFFLTIDILRPGLLESHYRRKGGEALAEIVTKALHTYKSTSIRQISTAQREVYDCFLRMGFHKAQLETAIDGISLDIILQEPIQLAVEVNGITHFARNAVDLPVGNAEWKKRLLHAMHWKLISIKVDQWNQLRGPENRAKFLADAIRS